MSFDSQGKLRGSCSRCECKVFTAKPSSVKCRCDHAPTVHEHVHLDSVSSTDSSTDSQLARQENTTKIFDITNAISLHHDQAFTHPGYHRQSSWLSQFDQQNPKQPYCHKCDTKYSADIGACPICFKRDDCPCGKNIKFFDPTFGLFQYCSPTCRDKYVLPDYNKKLLNDLSNPLRMDGTPVSVDFNSIARASHAPAKQSTIILPLPSLHCCVQFYKHPWTEDDKCGLLVTGLKLDEDTDLLLADLFIGTTTKRFSNKASHYEMMEKYKNTVQGQIYRKYDFKLICKKAKQKGLTEKCSGRNSFAFFLRKTQFFGMMFKTENNQVIVSAINERSIAECSGIKANDIIQSIGSVNSDQTDSIEFKDVTEEKNITPALRGQASTLIGFVFIIQRPIITSDMCT